MTFPPRIVSILVPVQCVLVLLGWAICRKLVRMGELVHDEKYGFQPKPGVVLFASQLAWPVAALSCVWGLAATLRAGVDGNKASIRNRDVQAGYTLTGIICVGMLWCILRTVIWAFGPPSVL